MARESFNGAPSTAGSGKGKERSNRGLEHLRRLHRQRANFIECSLKAGSVVARSVQLLRFLLPQAQPRGDGSDVALIRATPAKVAFHP